MVGIQFILAVMSFASADAFLARRPKGQENIVDGRGSQLVAMSQLELAKKNIRSNNATAKDYCSGSWVNNIMEERVFSQNGEDGVFATIFKHVQITKKSYVEFGTQDGSERNTRSMQEHYGWSGLLMDGGYDNPKINLHKEMITPSNIVELFEKYKVSKTALGLLSVDIDSYDFWILKSILEAGYQPDVISHEVNSQLKTGGLYTVPPPEVTKKPMLYPGEYNFGASPEAFAALGVKHGYKMIYCENMGVNCFQVKNSLLAKKDAACVPEEVRKPPAYCYGCWPSNGIAFYELNPDLSVKHAAVYPKCIWNTSSMVVQNSNGDSNSRRNTSGSVI